MPRRCALVDLPDGGVGFLCGENLQRCQEPGCGRLAEALCDYVVGKRTRTCDRRLCARHRNRAGVKGGDTIDYCPQHALAAATAPRQVALPLEDCP